MLLVSQNILNSLQRPYLQTVWTILNTYRFANNMQVLLRFFKTESPKLAVIRSIVASIGEVKSSLRIVSKLRNIFLYGRNENTLMKIF